MWSPMSLLNKPAPMEVANDKKLFWKEQQLVKEINLWLKLMMDRNLEAADFSGCYRREALEKEAKRFYEMAKQAADELARIHEKRS